MPALAQSLGRTGGWTDKHTYTHTHSANAVHAHRDGWARKQRRKALPHPGPLLKAKDLQSRVSSERHHLGVGKQSRDGRSHPSGSSYWGGFMGASSRRRVHRPPPAIPALGRLKRGEVPGPPARPHLDAPRTLKAWPRRGPQQEQDGSKTRLTHLLSAGHFNSACMAQAGVSLGAEKPREGGVDPAPRAPVQAVPAAQGQPSLPAIYGETRPLTQTASPFPAGPGEARPSGLPTLLGSERQARGFRPC